MRFPRFLIAIAATCCLFFVGIDNADAAKWYNRSALTGGGANALDAIPGSADGMDDTETKALVITASAVYHYDLDLTSGATESSPNVIAPDTAAGTKRWILINSFAQIIATDTTFYVSTTGNDTTGNGTVGAPWASLGKAISYLNGFYWDVSSVDVTIQLADGTYTPSADIVIDHPCASSLYIYGNRTASSQYAIAGVGDSSGDYVTVAGDRTTSFPAWSYLTISDDTNNDGLYLVTSSSYSAPNTTIVLNGATQLKNDGAYDGNVNSMPWTCGVIVNPTADITYLFDIKNGSSIGGIDGFYVNNSVTNADTAFKVSRGGTANVGPKVLVKDFVTGYYATEGGVLFAEETAAFSCNYGYRAGKTAIILASESYSIEHAASGYYAETNGTILADSSFADGNADYGYSSNTGSYISATLATARKNRYGFVAADMSRIYAYASTAAGNTDGDYLPLASTADFPFFGADGSWIYGGTETESKAVLEEIQAEDATGLMLKNDGGTLVATVADDGTFDVAGRIDAAAGISLPWRELSAAGPTDNVNVAGVHTIYLITTSNNVVIGGFVGGVKGQHLDIVKGTLVNNATLEHVEGTGNQDISLNSGADETLTGVRGGWRLNFDGTAWREVQN